MACGRSASRERLPETANRSGVHAVHTASADHGTKWSPGPWTSRSLPTLSSRPSTTASANVSGPSIAASGTVQAPAGTASVGRIGWLPTRSAVLTSSIRDSDGEASNRVAERSERAFIAADLARPRARRPRLRQGSDDEFTFIR